ncbi:FtsK/SpoIIIE family DNA translocase [Neopoerus faecalis]|uniref:FtsK/SpoIIIE family DNA translocase n=1 Tax=Neopoerus faecalis TaxID=3032125 RepID=UPI002570FCBE|nr:DNA translocase FtsK [Neopoerus faecalis]
MASTSQKKTTGKKSGTSGSRTAARKPQPRPIRREVGGVVCLILALCVFVSYFGISAIFIDALAMLAKGLIGYGYWVLGPALVLTAFILLFHHGRPVTLRVISAMLLPVLLGSLVHMLRVKEAYASSIGIIPALWKDGIALQCGGVLSGVLAQGFVAVFSKIASIIIFTVLLVVLTMVALRLTVGALIEKHRERPRYEVEPEEPIQTGKRTRKPEPAIPAESSRARIDIPVDDPVDAPAPKPEKTGFTGFFRHRSEQQKTPAQIVAAQKAAAEESEPYEDGDPFAVKAPAAPVMPPKPIQAREEPAPRPAIPTMEPVVLSQPEEPAAAAQPMTASPAASASVSAPAAAVQEPLSKKAAAQAVAAETAAVTAEIAENMTGSETEYRYPPVSLLRENQGENHIAAGAELRNNSRRLAETLSSFGVDAKAGDVIHGPSVTRYEFTLDQGVKLSKITNLQDDIALALGASGVRIAAVPNKISVVGIEVPNRTVTPVLIRDVIESRDFMEHPSKTAFALGRDIGGRNIIGNIEKLPHVLIAGTTGSGKSVCTNSLIISLLYKSTPDEVRFIMVDPKMVELAPYNGIPHLLIPVVTDPKKAAGALQWAVFEMMKRYKTFSENGVKKLEEYNKVAATRDDLEKLPSVVVVIDELADLMLVAAKEVEESICRVAQMGRAAGVHLVIATQRPSADVITGLMKANIPSRIAFAVASSLESRIILDTTGAEKLVGKGDMLYAPLGEGKPTRVQGCFISPEEIEAVVAYVKESGEANYSQEVIAQIEQSVQEKDNKGTKGAGSAADAEDSDEDELLPAAVDVVLETGQASVSMLQRRLKLGYSRAARLVDQMEDRGIVGPFEGSKPRQLLITRAQWDEMRLGGAPAGTEETPPFDTEE